MQPLKAWGERSGPGRRPDATTWDGAPGGTQEDAQGIKKRKKKQQQVQARTISLGAKSNHQAGKRLILSLTWDPGRICWCRCVCVCVCAHLLCRVVCCGRRTAGVPAFLDSLGHRCPPPGWVNGSVSAIPLCGKARRSPTPHCRTHTHTWKHTFGGVQFVMDCCSCPHQVGALRKEKNKLKTVTNLYKPTVTFPCWPKSWKEPKEKVELEDRKMIQLLLRSRTNWTIKGNHAENPVPELYHHAWPWEESLICVCVYECVGVWVCVWMSVSEVSH